MYCRNCRDDVSVRVLLIVVSLPEFLFSSMPVGSFVCVKNSSPREASSGRMWTLWTNGVLGPWMQRDTVIYYKKVELFLRSSTLTTQHPVLFLPLWYQLYKG